MSRRLLLCLVFVTAFACALSAAQANILGNCCYTLTRYNISTQGFTHLNGTCSFSVIEDGATWAPATCPYSPGSANCGACGHVHTNYRLCGVIQDRCSIESGHECGANFHTGSAIRCHKSCSVGGCPCQGGAPPLHWYQ